MTTTMPSELIPLVFVGDNIRVKATADATEPVADDHSHAGVWNVVRRNPTGWGVTQPATNRKGTVPFMLAVPTTEPLAQAPAPAASDLPASVSPGQLVRLSTLGAKQAANLGLSADSVLVVIADKGDKVNVARLGGEPNGGYIRAPRALLSAVIDPADLLN